MPPRPPAAAYARHQIVRFGSGTSSHARTRLRGLSIIYRNPHRHFDMISGIVEHEPPRSL